MNAPRNSINILLGSSAPYIEIGTAATRKRQEAIRNPTHQAPTQRGSSAVRRILKWNKRAIKVFDRSTEG